MGFLGKLFDIILIIIFVPIVILKFILAGLTKKPAYGPKKNKNEIEAEFEVEDTSSKDAQVGRNSKEH